MKIICKKCKKYVQKITSKKLDDEHTTQLDAHCHGEIDTMFFPDEWVEKNQDFVFAIMNDMCTGSAFDDEKKEGVSDKN